MAQLTARGLTVQVDRPMIMAVINATPDSFSDAGKYSTLEARMERTREVLEQGADILDVGGQSAITGVPEISEQEEIDRISPVIEWIAANSSAIVSVDTYRPQVARAALSAGAHIINDISGLMHREVADAVGECGAGYILMHNRGRPKVRLTDANLYEDVVADVLEFMDDRLAVLSAAGVSRQQVILDPGPDFSKTPPRQWMSFAAWGSCWSTGGRCCCRCHARTSSAPSRAAHRGSALRERWRRLPTL